jgi:drug/metabolite transporter (DMT)-like permease
MPRFDIIKILAQTTDSIRQLGIYNPFTIHKKGTKTKAMFALALVCILWGTTWISSKQAVKYMPALQMAGIRQIIGGTIYVTFFLLKGAKLPKGKEWIPVIILSILNFVCSNGLSVWGVQYISAGLGAIIGAIFPLWLVVIGLFSASSKIPVKAVIGLLLGFGGVCVIFYEHLHDFSNSDFRFGIMLSLIATWTWAFGTLYTKKQALSFNPYFSLGLQMLLSGIFLTVITKLVHSPSVRSYVPLSDIPLISWLNIAYLAIFGSVIAFICYLYALQNLPTEQASIYAYVNPVVAVLLGWLFYNEHLTIFIAIGGAVALLGIYLVNKAFKMVPPIEQPETEGI